jgi:hypothetical protein
VQIIKEVPGVLTCDHAISARARRVRRISYPALHCLARLGSRVVQAKAVVLGWLHRTSLMVRRIGEDLGTQVTVTEAVEIVDHAGHPAYGLACRSGLTVVRLPADWAATHGAATCAELDLEIDGEFFLANLAVWCLPAAAAEQLHRLRPGLIASVTTDCARISLLDGAGGRGSIGVRHGLQRLQAAAVPVLATFKTGTPRATWCPPL